MHLSSGSASLAVHHIPSADDSRYNGSRMMGRVFFLAFAVLLSLLAAAQAPSTKPAAPNAQSKEPATQQSQATKKLPDPEVELQRSIEDAGSDRAALVRNFEDYLRHFPDAPRKVQVYRAIVEASMQLHDTRRALDYAERIIALRPDDSELMLFTVDLLERAGDDSSLKRAVGYATRVLDRVEKATADSRSARVSFAEWQAQHMKVRMSVYYLRGRLLMERRDYDAALADLETCYRLIPNPAAALRLGEIAELRKDYHKAIEHYVSAFVLPDQEGMPADRRDVRRKLGNLWQIVHGSEAGLGARLLEAYDRTAAEPKPAGSSARNSGATAAFDFALRRLDGAAAVKLADWKGKVLVLNFWATWCLPCRELEPIFEQVGRQYEGKSDVFFLAVNDDEDESLVQPFLERQKMRATVVFSDGLESFLGIKAYPTVIVLDRSGQITYRVQGFDPDTFEKSLSVAIERALAGSS